MSQQLKCTTDLEKNVLKKLYEIVDSCILYIQEVARDSTELHDILYLSFDELGEHINDDNMNDKQIVKARLKGISPEEILNDPDYIIPRLWDTEFDITDYRTLGINDGELQTAQRLLRILGDEDKAHEAGRWIYTDD